MRAQAERKEARTVAQALRRVQVAQQHDGHERLEDKLVCGHARRALRVEVLDRDGHATFAVTVIVGDHVRTKAGNGVAREAREDLLVELVDQVVTRRKDGSFAQPLSDGLRVCTAL